MTRHHASQRTIALSLIGGSIHAFLALWLSTVVRGGSVQGTYVPETLSGVVLTTITVVGLVLLGGVPIVLLYRMTLVAPILAVILLFSTAFYSSYRYFEESRVTGATSLSLYYDSLFGVLWFVPLAIVLVLGGIEYVVRYGVERHAV